MAEEECEPEYIYIGPNTEDENDRVLVGCCNEDHTWKTGGSTARECLNPANMCQRGHCNEETHECEGGGTNNDDYSNAPGTCVILNDFCLLGVCKNEQCQPDSDGLTYPRCDDGVECTGDTCDSATYEEPTCSNPALTGTDCAYPDTDPCTKGVCNAGECDTAVPDVGAFCGSASGNTCYPAECDANGDCQPAGNPITCDGSIPICKKWSCSWDGSTSSCTKIPKDYTTYPENDCDDDPHDCNVKRCNKNANCTGKAPNKLPPTDPDYDPELNDFICDSNFADPLVDCIAGRCDARKNCLEGVPVANPYPGETCQSDTDVCTQQTCQGTSCDVTACATTQCGSCGSVGTCSGTPPNCSCVQ